MKRKIFIGFVIVLIGILLIGCGKETYSNVSGGIQFEELTEEEARKYLENFNSQEIKTQIVHKGLKSVYAAVNIPFNADIRKISLEDGNIIIDFNIKKDMAMQDPFNVISTFDRKVIVLNGKYKKYFVNEKVKFAVDGTPVEQTIDYYTALLLGQDYMETDFTTDMNGMELYNTGDQYRLAYIFSFLDSENMNRAGNETTTGVIAVDAETGEVLEYRIFSRNRFPGTYRFTSDLQAEGWKDDMTVVATDEEEYFLVDSEGGTTHLELTDAQGLIDTYNQTVIHTSGYIFTQECDENDDGFVYTTKARITRVKDGRSISISVPPNVYIAYHRWGASGDNLYFTTELAEPSYGDFWSCYTLWQFNVNNRTLKELGKLPSREFFLSPDETRISFNGPDGDIFMMNIDKLIRDDEILK